MEVREIRQLNFERLITEFLQADGDHKRNLRMFAELFGLNPAHLSQIRSGHRKIGSRLARQIELKMTPKPPIGWMDKEHRDGDPANKGEQEMARAAVHYYRLDRVGAKKLLDLIESEFAKQKKALKAARRTAKK